MKKKTGILIGILVIPVFLFFIIKWAGIVQPDVNLPYFIPIDETENVDGEIDTVYHQVPDFSFIDSKNRVVTLDELDDQIYVANFIFTRCAVNCPLMTSQLLRVYSVFEDNPHVRFLSHTVDPENDSPETLKLYKEGYQIKGDQWLFLTGEKKEIYNQAIKGYYLAAGEENSDVGFFHTDKIALVDKQRHIRGFYSGTDSEDIERLITEIGVLLKAHENETKK